MSQLKKVYIFIGPPGSGKGSLSSLCVNNFGWVQLSTGNLCRKHIAERTEIGKQIDFALKSGKLIPDSLIVNMVDEWLDTVAESTDAVILDGYPRTVAQARSFNDYLNTKENWKTQIIKFSVDENVIINRLCSRYTCTNQQCQAVYSLISGSSLAPKKANMCDRCSSALSKREDDNEIIIKERLNTYHKHEKDLLNFYYEQGYPVIDVDVNKNLDTVFMEFKQLMNNNTSLL